MNKTKSKLDKLNVPELFYSRFVSNVPRGDSPVADKLHDTDPTARGRGSSRVITDLTEDEWNDLYQRAAEARKKMRNYTKDSGHRRNDLRPAICAKSLAERMEERGVDSPVTFANIRGPSTKAVTPAPVVIDYTDDTDDIPAVLRTPLVLDTADDVSEVNDVELQGFQQDIQTGL